jgi:hypothetical protein
VTFAEGRPGRGLVRGADALSRMQTFSSVPRLLLSTAVRGSWNRNLGEWEQVDWSVFDIVSADLYRSAANAASFRDKLQSYLGHGKPLAITEFGSCTYRGAASKGAMGWAVVDRTATPPALRAGLIRDEKEQAGYLTDLLGIFADAAWTRPSPSPSPATAIPTTPTLTTTSTSPHTAS